MLEPLSNGCIENEANEFASELLLPKETANNFINQSNDINFENIIQFCKKLEVSKAFALRKLQPLSKIPVAFIFSYKGKVRYIHCDNFPFIKIWSRDSLPNNSVSHIDGDENTVQKKVEVNPKVWLKNSINQRLYEQLFIQEDGYRVTMLTLN